MRVRDKVKVRVRVRVRVRVMDRVGGRVKVRVWGAPRESSPGQARTGLTTLTQDLISKEN